MVHPRDIADLRTRIAKAALDSDIWRAAGLSEKYLEAYSRMEALEVESAAMLHAQRRDRRLEALRGPVEPASHPNVVSVSADRAQAMANFSIAYDGVRY